MIDNNMKQAGFFWIWLLDALTTSLQYKIIANLFLFTNFELKFFCLNFQLIALFKFKNTVKI